MSPAVRHAFYERIGETSGEQGKPNSMRILVESIVAIFFLTALLALVAQKML